MAWRYEIKVGDKTFNFAHHPGTHEVYISHHNGRKWESLSANYEGRIATEDGSYGKANAIRSAMPFADSDLPDNLKKDLRAVQL